MTAAILALVLLAEPNQDILAGARSIESNVIARAAIVRALDATGSQTDSTLSIALEGRGFVDRAARYQGRTPDGSNRSPFREVLAVDANTSRVAYQHELERFDGSLETWRFVYLNGDEMRFVDLTDKFAVHLQGAQFAGKGLRHARAIPQILLRDALSHGASLRHRGSIGHDGRPLDIVSFSLDGGEVIDLEISRETGLLEGFSFLIDMPMWGDVPIRWEYLPYRRIDSLGLHPSGYRLYIEDRLYKEVRYETIAVEDIADHEVFAIPAGIEAPEPPKPSPPNTRRERRPEVVELAEGVWQIRGIRGGFDVAVAEIDDGLLVFDAPSGWYELQEVPATNFEEGATSSSIGARLLELARELAPDKPVRFLALSHFHSDHAGGLRPFIADGVKILTTDTAKELISRVAGRQHAIVPDALQRSPREPQVEIVSGSQTFAGPSGPVTLIELDSPHVEGMLVLHIPDEGIMFVADIFHSVPLAAYPPKTELEVNRFFVEWLKANQLEPTRIYGIHGGDTGTPEHLAKISELLEK